MYLSVEKIQKKKKKKKTKKKKRRIILSISIFKFTVEWFNLSCVNNDRAVLHFSNSLDNYLSVVFLGYADIFVLFFLKVFFTELCQNLSVVCYINRPYSKFKSWLYMTVLVFIYFIIMRKYLSQLCSIDGIIVIIIMSKTDVFTKNFQTRGIIPSPIYSGYTILTQYAITYTNINESWNNCICQ